MGTSPVTCRTLEDFYHVNANTLERQYKNVLSGYRTWSEASHAEEWLVFPENIGPHIAIDETSLSNGELYTVVTNRDRHGRERCLVAIVAGTKAEDVIKALERIPQEFLDKVEEVHRWEAIQEANDAMEEAKLAGKAYEPVRYGNGDTKKELLARSRYLLFKSGEKWTQRQRERAGILFNEFPDIKKAYGLSHSLRMIFSKNNIKDAARLAMAKWYNQVEEAGFHSFNVIAATFHEHYEDILNFYVNRSSNASAESFNAKIKSFRAALRGIVDEKFFLYRLSMIYAYPH